MGLAALRLQELVRHARELSPFYGRLYARLPRGDVPLAALAPVGKRRLMEDFDDWCCDRRVTRAALGAFFADRALVGERFLGSYHAWKSSGTSGAPGLFVHDAFAMGVYGSLVAARLVGQAMPPGAAARSMARAGRAAIVCATGDHYAAASAWRHMASFLPGLERRAIAVTLPLERMVRELDAFDPASLAAYPSVLSLLAPERRAGRLLAAPGLLWSGGEALGPRARRAIEDAFGCPLINEYGASECLSIASECAAGWMHLDSDWVILEPVDAHGAPCAPGETSHTALLTNLANRVQPVIRYDLGDRVTPAKGACPCGDPRPAFRVEGRCGDAVALRSARGKLVRVVPLALETVLEEAGVEPPFQLVRGDATRLALRLRAAGPRQRTAAWRRARDALHTYLEAQGLANVRLCLDRAAPRLDRRSGKLHAVVGS